MCEPFFQYSRGQGTYYDGETRIFRKDGSPVYMFSMGGLAEYACIPATSVFPLPSSLIDEPKFVHSAIIGCAVFTAYGGRHPLFLWLWCAH
jgi:succinate semialdehyde reductase (NADPH)